MILVPRQNMNLGAVLLMFSKNAICLKFSSLRVILIGAVSLICFADKTSTSESSISRDYLLCRQCGSDTADLSYLTNIRSSSSLLETNQTLSGQSTLVQTLKNPLGIKFNIITVKKSACIGFGDWHGEFSWFEGYAWKICVCQHCRQMLGWIFEPLKIVEESQNKASVHGFYAIIVDNVLSEQFSNSLLIIPKAFKS